MYEYDLNPNIYDESCCSNIKQYDSSENKYNPIKQLQNNFIHKLQKRIANNTRTFNVESLKYSEPHERNSSSNIFH